MALSATGSLFSERLCRICAFESDENEPLFRTTNRVPALTDSGKMFASCLVMELNPDDGYPTTICFRCNTQLRMFSEFRKGALHMHTKFTEKLQKQHLLVVATPPVVVKQEIEPIFEEVNIKPKEETLLEILGGQRVDAAETKEVDDVETECLGLEERLDDEDEQQHEEEMEEELTAEQVSFVEWTDHYEATIDGLCDNVSVIEATTDDEMDVMYLEDVYNDELDYEAEYVDSCSPADDDLIMAKPKRPRLHSNQLQQQQPTTLSIVPNDSITCELCNKSIKMSVKNHVCVSDQMFKCEICSKEFVLKQRRDMHQARHSDERPIGCDLCEKSFKNKYDLKVHLRSHGDVRSYVCDICGRAFRASTHLANHIQSHVNENLYQCDYCNQRYKTPITLLRHITSMHTKKDEFKCTICSKSFGLKFRFQRHMKIHEKPARNAIDVFNE